MSYYLRRGGYVFVRFVCVSVCLRVSVCVCKISEQESRAVAREPRDAAAVVIGLTFAENIHYKF